MEIKKETENLTDTLETVIFTDISEQRVNTSKATKILILMQYLAITHDLNIQKDYDKVKELLIKSVKYN